MTFDFDEFIQNLRENPDKKETVQKYEEQFGPIEGDVQDQIWYQNYVNKFDTVDYKVPEDLSDDFDWKLLMKLVAGSFSSDGLLDLEGKINQEQEESEQDTKQIEGENIKPEFIISVQSGNQQVVKKLSELWGFQIARLYEIYIEEQMNLQILIKENEEEKKAIENKRESRKKRWELVLDKLDMELSKEENKKEKEKEKQKIDELKDML